MSKVFKVIKIIDDKSLIINAGSFDDVKVGDRFEIYCVGEPIFDPYTKENLGTLDTIKDQLTVKTVYEKMCICYHPPVYHSSITYMNTSIFSKITEEKGINIDPTEISGANFASNVIKIGDCARYIAQPLEK